MVKNTEIMERIQRTEVKIDKAFSIVQDVRTDVAEMKPTMQNMKKVFETGGSFDKLVSLVDRHDVKIDNHEKEIEDLKEIDKGFFNKDRTNLIAIITFLTGIVMYALSLWTNNK